MNEIRMTHRSESVRVDYTEIIKEIIRGLYRSEDKKVVASLLETMYNCAITMHAKSQDLSVHLMDTMVQIYKSRIAAYEKRYEMKRVFSFRPERIEQQIAGHALEDTRKIIADMALIAAPLIQGFLETNQTTIEDLRGALVGLLQGGSPEALENLKSLVLQGRVGERNGER